MKRFLLIALILISCNGNNLEFQKTFNEKTNILDSYYERDSTFFTARENCLFKKYINYELDSVNRNFSVAYKDLNFEYHYCSYNDLPFVLIHKDSYVAYKSLIESQNENFIHNLYKQVPPKKGKSNEIRIYDFDSGFRKIIDDLLIRNKVINDSSFFIIKEDIEAVIFYTYFRHYYELVKPLGFTVKLNNFKESLEQYCNCKLNSDQILEIIEPVNRALTENLYEDVIIYKIPNFGFFLFFVGLDKDEIYIKEKIIIKSDYKYLKSDILRTIPCPNSVN